MARHADADPVGPRPPSIGSVAVAAAGGADAVAGLLEDVLDDAAESEDDDDDQGRDAGDEQAVLDRGCAALVHLGQSGVEHDAQVVEHGGGSLVGMCASPDATLSI